VGRAARGRLDDRVILALKDRQPFRRSLGGGNVGGTKSLEKRDGAATKFLRHFGN